MIISDEIKMSGSQKAIARDLVVAQSSLKTLMEKLYNQPTITNKETWIGISENINEVLIQLRRIQFFINNMTIGITHDNP